MKKVITIEGMRCAHCTSNVEKALRAIPGVSDVAVDLAAKTATVEAADSVTDESLKKAVDDLAFQVVDIR
ncbi:heavy-metal-associated domain-containing protein [Mailhella sp.]|uniref:heavy-metal-associated domain-containing protein n=1 Tax=Mailhella sp. TaxID=1981029 RepID=UPI003AB61567